MNIMISGMDENLGGTERFIVSQLRFFTDHDSHIFLINDMRRSHLAYENQFTSLGIEQVFNVTVSEKKHPIRFFFEIRKICCDYSIDAIIINVNTARVRHLLELFAAKSAGVTIRIMHSHNASCDNFKARLNRILCWPFFKTDFLHLITKRFACSIEAGVWEFSKMPFKIIKNGIDVNSYAFQAETRMQYRSLLGLKEKQNFFIHVGRISQQKNTGYLVNLFNDYHQKHPDDVLMVVGGIDTVRAEYENVVKTLDLLGKNTYIRLLGARDDIPELLCAADIFMLPSLYEGFPIVAIEAQCSGLPCVMSTNVTKDVNLNGLSQFVDLSAPRTAWINAMEKAIEYRSIRDRSDGKVDTMDYSLEVTAKEYWDEVFQLINEEYQYD